MTMGNLTTLTTGDDTLMQSDISANSGLVIRSLAGNDIIVLDRTDDLGGGNDVDTASGKDTVINHKEFGNLITLGAGNDTYLGLGFGSFGTDPADRVFAGAGNDTVAVQTFHSQYFGQAGNDIFHSVGWANTFNGGAGRDTISYLPRIDDGTVGDTGVDVDLRAGIAQTGATRQERLVSIENVIGSDRADRLLGSAGANQITGGKGFDVLTGRAGADAFVYNNPTEAPIDQSAADVITDFNRAQGDRINLSGMDADVNLTGNQAFRFINTGFTGHAGELRFEAGSVIGDVTGDGAGDFRIMVGTVTTLQAIDFIL
jgi:Ca2+-binding RTX toxin-like protein